MNIKAIFPPGVSTLIVNGLHQWDYGRKLEIRADDLPALVEVHFACEGMKDAVVRSCNAVGGVVEAAIPDACLEQTSPITAWIYEIGASSGETIKTVTMPIIARARPQLSATIPEEVGDKYTEAVAAMNAAVDSVKTGNVVVSKALKADSATKADTATKADSAIKASILTVGSYNDNAGASVAIDDPGLYLVTWVIGTNNFSAVLCIADLDQNAFSAGDGTTEAYYDAATGRITATGSDGDLEERIKVYLIGSVGKVG